MAATDQHPLIDPILLSEPHDDFYLSSLTPSDFPRLIDLYNNTDLAQILRSPPFPYTLSDAQWFHDFRANAPVPAFPGLREGFIIRSRSNDGLLIGICGVHPLHEPGNPRDFMIGYMLAPEFRGKGILTTVLGEVLKLFPGAYVEAQTELTNIASQKVLEKNGFTKLEGIVKMDWPEGKGGGFKNTYMYEKRL